MERKYKILIAIGVGFFVGVVFWAIATTPTEPPPTEKIDPPSKMTYESNTITEEKNGVKIFELNSSKMLFDAITQNAEIVDAQGKFYREDGTFIELNAKYGVYNRQTGAVHVEGDVVLTDSNGAKLTSGKIDCNVNYDLFIATENVKISKKDMRAFADYAEANNGFRHFKLKGNAKVLRGVKESEDN